jgi:hypothetical protein
MVEVWMIQDSLVIQQYEPLGLRLVNNVYFAVGNSIVNGLLEGRAEYGTKI